MGIQPGRYDVHRTVDLTGVEQRVAYFIGRAGSNRFVFEILVALLTGVCVADTEDRIDHRDGRVLAFAQAQYFPIDAGEHQEIGVNLGPAGEDFLAHREPGVCRVPPGPVAEKNVRVARRGAAHVIVILPKTKVSTGITSEIAVEKYFARSHVRD